MASAIESAARALAALIESGDVTETDHEIFLRSVKECDEDTNGEKSEYRTLAKQVYESEGDLEFDGDCVVSLSEDGGAYVQCWKWIPKEDQE
jgi:hypothetical protein